MKCQNCGRELKNGARFCIGCGAQHDENGQLVGSYNAHVDYSQNMMYSNDMPEQNGNNVDYNKTMMFGSTDFKQYQPEQNQQSFQQYNEAQNDYSANNNYVAPQKKKISPIMIICPIIIIGALAYTFFGGKKNNDVKKTIKETVAPEVVVATISESTKSEVEEVKIPENGWSEDGMNFYKDSKMIKDAWVDDDNYYVDEDGKKLIDKWVDGFYVGPDGKKLFDGWTKDHYYVDENGKKATNRWVRFEYTSDAKDKKDGEKIGYYYVDEDGNIVKDEMIFGKYVDEEGCYWATPSEIMPNSEEEMEVEKAKVTETEKKTEEDIVKETTIQQVETTQPSLVAPTQVVVPETVANIIAPTVKAVESDGKTIAYQTITESFPNEKISKYVSIVITDTNYPNLALAINDEWKNNREKTGIAAGETILSNNKSVTYDVKVERNDNRIFSLCVTKSKLDNNVVYEVEKTGYTWDVNTGAMLSLDTLLNDSEENYSKLSKDVIKKVKNYRNTIDDDIYNEIVEGDEDAVFEYCTWYMGVTGITFVFNKNQIESTKRDGLSFTLTYPASGDNVNKLLLSKYRKS